LYISIPMKYFDEIYGELNLVEPVVLDLLNSRAFQRLKGIRPNGVSYYFDHRLNQTRFEHCLGVYHILKSFGASLAEQIAGLLHDVSHQVFSHVMDFVHNTGPAQDYQDSIHHTLFKKGELKDILEKYHLDSSSISNLKKWPRLDNELPNICADRLDYTFRDSFQLGFINRSTVSEILADLTFEPQKGFVFKHLELAQIFGRLSYKMQIQVWHNFASETSFKLMSEILKYASDQKLILDNDYWLADDDMVKKLLSFNDFFINQKWQQLIALDPAKPGAHFKKSKFRVVNPWVANQRLTELDFEFKQMFEEEKIKYGRSGIYCF